MHMLPGRVSSVDESHDGKHATVTITHGKRKRSKDDKGQPGELHGYDRPSSRVVMPKAHAAKYPLGTKVPAIGMDEEDDDMPGETGDDGADEEAQAPAPPPTDNIAPKPKAKHAPPPPPKKRSASERPILRAMTARRKK